MEHHISHLLLSMMIILGGCSNTPYSPLGAPVKTIVKRFETGDEIVLKEEASRKLFNLIVADSSIAPPYKEGVTVQPAPFAYSVSFVFRDGYELVWEITQDGSQAYQPRIHMAKRIDPGQADYLARALFEGIENRIAGSEPTANDALEGLSDLPELPPTKGTHDEN